MADTAAALVIQLSADFKDFKKQMQSATGVFDTEGRKIAKKQAALVKQLSSWPVKFTGIDGLSKAFVGLTAAGIVGGIGALVKKSLDAASAIGDTAQQAGVSIEVLQKLRFAASQSGASFDIMDTALTTLNKTFGDFLNTGAGKGAQTFKTLGIDKLIKAGDVRNTEQLFDVIVKKVSAFGSEAEKSGFLASTFGKEAGPKLLQLVNQGTDGLARLEAQAVSLGIVLSTKTVLGAKEASDKLDALFNVIKAQGVAAVASLAPEIAHLADEITKGLPDLILWVERWAAYFNLIELTPVQKLNGQIKDIQTEIANSDQLKDSAFLNPLGIMSANIDAKKGELLAKLAGLQDDVQHALKMEQTTRGHHAHPGDNLGLQWKGGIFDQPLKINDIAGQAQAEQEAKALATAQQRARETLAQTVLDKKTADAALLAAQDQTSVQLLKGSAAYLDAVKKQIDDEYQSRITVAEAERDKQKEGLDKQKGDIEKHGGVWKDYGAAVANVNEELTAKIQQAAEERKQALDQVDGSQMLRDAATSAKEQIQAFQDEAAALGLTAGAMAKLVFVQGQLADATRQGITLTQEQIATIDAQGDAVGKAAQVTHDASDRMNDVIQANDTLREGLTDIGVAGLHGFGSVKEAAAGFLNQLAEMIIRIGVMKPLLDGLLGQSGSSGSGGLFGNIFGSIFGGGGDLLSNTNAAIAANPLLFAGGGFTGFGPKNEPAGVVHRGEVVWSQDDIRRAGGLAVVESWRKMPGYAAGGVVGAASPAIPGIPAIQPHRRAISPQIFIDARGAQNGVGDEIRKQLEIAYPTLVKASVDASRKEFPVNLQNTVRDRG